MRKGILLAGGTGTRLYPCTETVSKHLLPVYDKPLIYYSLSTLMLSGIRDILIISSTNDKKQYQNLLGNGSRFGINLSYEIQEKPNGIAECFSIGKNFIEDNDVALILGDNIFYGNNLVNILQKASNNNNCTLFAYHSPSPERFGVLKYKHKKPISIIEKPKNPPSNYAITGLYFYDNDVVDYFGRIKPSDRNELEITDINNIYLKEKSVNIQFLNRGIAWIDAGTPESLFDASVFVRSFQKRTNTIICCPEEIAYNNRWLSKNDLETIIVKYGKSDYAKYLEQVLKDDYITNVNDN